MGSQKQGPARRYRSIIAIPVALAAAAVTAGCAAHTVQTTGTSTGTASAKGAAAAKAGAGTAIALPGNGSGEQVSVTVVKVIGTAKPGDAMFSAPAGHRLYAVQFRLHDTGPAAYSDSPSNGAEVTDSAGQSYQASMIDTASGCQAFPASENIAPGASGLGCIVFAVPLKAKIASVQFTLDSGMGPQTGQWDVG